MDIDLEPLVPSRLSSVVEVRRALHPLQAQADRVGRQVEEFAETLDRLSDFKKQGIPASSSQVLPLIQKYERIASETVTRLKRRHAEDKRELLRENRRRKLGHGTTASALALYDSEKTQEPPASTTVRDLLHWEQERQTWELLGLMLQVQYPAAEVDVHETSYKPIQRPQDFLVHRYSSEHAVYEKFLATDDVAWQKHVILEWLNRCADESRESVDDIVEDAAIQLSQKHTTNGWIHAKESIKAEKRLRSLPFAVAPEQLNLSTSLMGSSKKAQSVTQLDPDAFTRQGRELQSEDLAFEKTTWLGCWELLRRGKSWDEIRDWCEQRQEGWRALSMRGDPRLGRSKESGTGELTGRAHWQQFCVILARSGGIDDYERAVFGLLGGDMTSTLQVCKTWEDKLHGLLACELAQGYGRFFSSVFDLQKVPSPEENGFASTIERLREFLEQMKTEGAFSDEAFTPFRALQTAILNDNTASHFHNQGWTLMPQLQNSLYALEDLKACRNASEAPKGPTSPISLDDHDMIRVLAHVVILYQHLRPELVGGPATENILVAYIDFLGRAGKQQLLPLYASFLSEDRAATCLARQLPFIKDTSERQTIVRLMKGYGMEDEVVLVAQLDSILASARSVDVSKGEFPWLKILGKPSAEYKDVAPLRRDFIGDELEAWEEDLIDALEWFLLLKGDAKFNVYPSGIAVYRQFLRRRSYAAVRKLANTINVARISQLVKPPGQINGDVSSDHDAGYDMMVTDDAGADYSGLRRQTDQDRSLADMKIFEDFESLAIALEALDRFGRLVEDSEAVRRQALDGDKTSVKSWKRELQEAHTAVEEAMQPLLQGWLLPTKGRTESEMKEYHHIRVRMLPEMVLAYVFVLSFSGHWLQRENLLECLNLARHIADSERDVCEAFVDAHRMAELMTTMASISKIVLSASETTGGIKIKKRRGGGELLDVWSVHAEKTG